MKARDPFSQAREAMVENQIIARGVVDARVLAAMRAVPRHAFVPEPYQNEAYQDHPLPVGEGQTISQPYIVALMTSHLELNGEEKVLEIGTGSGTRRPYWRGWQRKCIRSNAFHNWRKAQKKR